MQFQIKENKYSTVFGLVPRLMSVLTFVALFILVCGNCIHAGGGGGAGTSFDYDRRISQFSGNYVDTCTASGVLRCPIHEMANLY